MKEDTEKWLEKLDGEGNVFKVPNEYYDPFEIEERKDAFEQMRMRSRRMSKQLTLKRK